MKRLISSPFRYADYRVLISDDLNTRQNLNKNYSLRSYAKDTGFSAGYISSILRGKKNLNKKNWQNFFKKIGFNDSLELEYIHHLILYKISDDRIEQTISFEYIRKHYETLGLKVNSEKDYFLKSAKHLLIFMILSKISQLDIAEKIFLDFGISKSESEQIIFELTNEGYLFIDNNSVEIIEKNPAITSSSKILPCSQELAENLFNLIKLKGGISFPERSTHTLIMGFDNSSFNQAIEVYKQFLHQIYRLSQNSKSIDRITVFNDVLVSVDTKTSENTN